MARVLLHITNLSFSGLVFHGERYSHFFGVFFTNDIDTLRIFVLNPQGFDSTVQALHIAIHNFTRHDLFIIILIHEMR